MIKQMFVFVNTVGGIGFGDSSWTRFDRKSEGRFQFTNGFSNLLLAMYCPTHLRPCDVRYRIHGLLWGLQGEPVHARNCKYICYITFF